jgi:dTMP kinase
MFCTHRTKDRAGKTTLCKGLVECLHRKGVDAVGIKFPADDVPSWESIQKLFRGEGDTTASYSHELMMRNRLEKREEILDLLSEGTVVICDRYHYSGAAYASAKQALETGSETPDPVSFLTLEEENVIMPDLVLYVTCDREVREARDGYGDGAHETPKFQSLVEKAYTSMLFGDATPVSSRGIFRVVDTTFSSPEHNIAAAYTEISPVLSGVDEESSRELRDITSEEFTSKAIASCSGSTALDIITKCDAISRELQSRLRRVRDIRKATMAAVEESMPGEDATTRRPWRITGIRKYGDRRVRVMMEHGKTRMSPLTQSHVKKVLGARAATKLYASRPRTPLPMTLRVEEDVIADDELL